MFPVSNQLNRYIFFWSELFLSSAIIYLDLMSLFLFPDLEVDAKSFHRFQVQQIFFFLQAALQH